MGKKILMIDDEELIIKSLTKLIEKNGYEVTVAKRGQDALIIAEEESFDLIISDIRMPGVNGIQTVKGIYEIMDKSNTERPPVIFITGFANKENEEEAKALKPVDYIYKPFDAKILLDRISQSIGA